MYSQGTSTAVQQIKAALVGCSSAHADNRLSGRCLLPIPTNPSTLWQTTLSANKGCRTGLGASSNGSIAAISYGCLPADSGTGCYTTGNLQVYGPNGTLLWQSGTELGNTTYSSAPIIGPDNSVIITDSATLIWYNPGGAIRKQVTLPSNVQPLSPVLMDAGHIALGFQGTNGNNSSPILGIYSGIDLSLIDTLTITDSGVGAGYFNTLNTISTNGNRIYIIAQYIDPASGRTALGRLYAIDLNVNASPGSRLTVAWFYSYGGPSGGSPLRIGNNIYFDSSYGTNTTATINVTPITPTAMAVQDNGTSCTLLYNTTINNTINAAQVDSPTGGIWFFALTEAILRKLDSFTGIQLDSIDVGALGSYGGAPFISSAINISGTITSPVMLFTISSNEFPGGGNNAYTYLIALDLVAKTQLWSVALSTTGTTPVRSFGQFPIMYSPTITPRIVVTRAYKGPLCIG